MIFPLVIFKSETTLRNQLVRPKDPVPHGRQDGVVYRIPCGECDRVYIGETGRDLDARMKEHDRDIRLGKTLQSAVAEHAHSTGHYPNWNNVKYVERDQHWYSRRLKEAIQIQLHPNNINRDNGIEISKAWLPIVRKHQSDPRREQTSKETSTSKT